MIMVVFLVISSRTDGHPGHDHDAPRGIWPAHSPDDESAGLSANVAIQIQTATESTVPVQATVWKLSDGTTGSSLDANIHANVNDVIADVNTVAYDDEYVYIRTSGVPSHPVGPFGDGNPAMPGDIDATYRVSLNPTEADVHAVTQLSNIGVAVNGAGLFNWSDATTWDSNTNTLGMVAMGQYGDWNTNALWFRKDGLDDAGGHPAGGRAVNLTAATYHYHQSPYGLVDQLDPNNTGQHHSPIIGYAFDGFPIYGPYAYANGVDDSEGIRQMTSSYQLIDSRPDDGPSEADYELGSFSEDFEYVEGSGTLNEFNMAIAQTPEYPEGTWAYFTTFDVDGSGTTLDGDVAFPFTVGPSYFGTVDKNMTSRNAVITVPGDVTFEFDYASIGLNGDCNSNGVIDLSDANCTTAERLSNFLLDNSYPLGDADGDREVQFSDFSILSNNFGSNGEYTDGDFDNNGTVQFPDFVILSSNFGQIAAVLAVPEPSAVAILFGLTALVISRGRSTQQRQ